MVWEQKVSLIGMITGLIEGDRTKCERYWPTQTDWQSVMPPTASILDGGNRLQFGEFLVSLVSEIESPSYTITHLELTRAGWNDVLRVTHMWQNTWDDHDAPSNINHILEFITEFRRLRKSTPGSVLVHCNAGIGRTGVLLAVDAALDQFSQERKCDILRTVCMLREDRGLSVPTKVSLAFAGCCLLTYFLGPICAYPSSCIRID